MFSLNEINLINFPQKSNHADGNKYVNCGMVCKDGLNVIWNAHDHVSPSRWYRRPRH
jgi:hypothetical protein